MTVFDYTMYGWKLREEDGMVVPVWFTGDQFPPSLKRSPRGKKRLRSSPSSSKSLPKRKTRVVSDGELADGELSEDNSMPPPAIEFVVPVRVIEYHLDTDTSGDVAYDDETMETGSSDTGDWGASETNLSSDSGSDSEWVP